MSPPALTNEESLRDAFQVFNELSQNLARSYAELESKVVRLTRELAAARRERMKTLAEKERLANRLQRLLEALPGGVLVTDGAGRIAEHNPAAARLLGEPLDGQPWRDVLERATRPCPEDPRQRELPNGGAVSLATTGLGEEAGHIILLADVSETRALQRWAEQRKRLSMLGEMVASLAHQVRTPLAAALLYTSNLASPQLNQAQRERFAAKLKERLQHLERQVNDMLAFARAGKLNLGKIDGRELLDKTRAAFAPTLAGKPVRLEVRAETEDARFHGNPDALQGVLLNLLNNALEAFEGKPGEIALTLTRPTPERLRLTVSDNGPGVPEEIGAQVFEAFFTTRPSGTGLGLAIADCVARAHGGRIELRSSPGAGASFSLDLPCLAAPSLLPGGYSGECQLPA